MTDADIIERIEAAPGNTLVAFMRRDDAMRYIASKAERGVAGVMCMVEDTRGRSGLTVIWRDPVPVEQLDRYQAQARWLLERIIAGQFPMPSRGEVSTLWSGGFPKHLAKGH